MAPKKRPRPTFSPPKPGKSKSSINAGGNGSKPKVGKGSLSKASTSKKDAKTSKRSRYASATESESDSQGADDTEDENVDEDMQDEDGDEAESEMDRDAEAGSESSPEPDFILAEVTREDPSTTAGPPIPLPLIHRILHSHFSHPDKTKLSKDAREVVGKYIEVFVREAIMRCAYEKSNDKSNSNTGEIASDGWLEVDDLEKAAVQLCLDF